LTEPYRPECRLNCGEFLWVERLIDGYNRYPCCEKKSADQSSFNLRPCVVDFSVITRKRQFMSDKFNYLRKPDHFAISIFQLPHIQGIVFNANSTFETGR
jgi:hypothetical protein